MDEKIIKKLSQEDADKLHSLRKQLDNGTLDQKTYNKRYKKLSQDLNWKYQPKGVKMIPKIIGLALLAMLIAGALMQALDSQSGKITGTASALAEQYDVANMVTNFELTNSSDKEMNVTCKITLQPSDKTNSTVTKEYSFDKVPANSTKKYQVVIPRVHFNASYTVEKDTKRDCQKKYKKKKPRLLGGYSYSQLAYASSGFTV